MWARKLIYKLMVMGPFILMTAIAVNSRTYNDGWITLEAGPALHERIAAFVRPCQAALSLQTKGSITASEKQVREVAALWIDGAESGKLRPIVPAFFGDSMEDGVKSQILGASHSIARRLRALGIAETDHGKYAQAAEDYLGCIRIAQILKASDFVSLSLSSCVQLEALRDLRAIVGHLTPEQAMQIASQLEQICPLNDEASEILNRSRRQYAVFSIRNGVEPLNIVEPDTLVRVSSLMKSGHPTPSAISYVRSIIVASRGETPQVLSLARIAWERSSAAKQEAKAAIVDLLASCCR